MPSFMTYEQWIALNPEAELEMQDCDKCNGDGEIECPHCYHVSECEKCGGEGYIKTARRQYQDALERDRNMLEKYQRVFAQ